MTTRAAAIRMILENSSFNPALDNRTLVNRVRDVLGSYSEVVSQPSKRLIAFSLCVDELNRPLEEAFTAGKLSDIPHFNLGGLSGFPFAGMTGFGAMASHIPDHGHCLWVYGPHVGLSHAGEFGKIQRYGMQEKTTCCGSAIVACDALVTHLREQVPIAPPTENPLDAQQALVTNRLLPYARQLLNEETRMEELPKVSYKAIDQLLHQILAKATPTTPVVLLGGIQINTPSDESDYFVPLRFDVREATTGNTVSLLKELLLP